MLYCKGDSNWRDQLSAVNGVVISYDNIGNPTYDGTWSYTWEKGRQLKSMSKSGTTANFKYNENGLRIQKTVNGVVTNYILHGKNIVHMTQGSNSMHFCYDTNNKPAIVEYNGTKYAYVHNLQGDIVAILDSNGTAVVQYKYDAWGRPIGKTGSMASTLGTVQPFRYRGYVYDEETGLYYLRSRLYSFSTSRFINADALINSNLYAYTANNPVRYCDADGYALCTAFADCGFGNPMASLTGGGCGGGGSSFAAYDHYYRSQSNVHPTGGLSISGPDPAEQFSNEINGYLQNWLDDNGVGKLANAAITGGSAAVAIKISGFCGAVGGPAGFGISLLLTVPIAFLGGMTGQIVENDLQPDNRFGGEMDQSNPMGIVNDGLVNSVSPIVPSSNDKVKNFILKRIRKQTKKFVERMLE